MNIISGRDNLLVIIKLLKENKPEFFSEMDYSYIKNKIKKGFLDTICMQTFMFYTDANSLSDSIIDADFARYLNKIIEIADIETFIILSYIDNIYLDKYKINWIIVELNLNSDVEIDLKKEDFKMVKYLKFASCLDVYREKTNPENSISYRIDFENMETEILKIIKGDYSKYLKNAKKYFFKHLFNLQNNKNKDNNIDVINQVLTKRNIEDIKIINNDYKKVFEYKCLICGNDMKVILSKSMRDNRKNSIKKYIRVNDDFIFRNNDGKYEVKCNHRETEFEDNNVNFTFNVTSNNLDKVFVYLINNFSYDTENKSIKYFKNDEITSYLIKNFIKKHIK